MTYTSEKRDIDGNGYKYDKLWIDDSLKGGHLRAGFLKMRVMNIQKGLSFWSASLLLLFIGILHAGSGNPAEVKAVIRQLTTNIGTKRPWKGDELTTKQQQSLSELHDLAFNIMKEATFARDMSALLEECKADDNYPRQQLFEAVVNGRSYSGADIPFLRNLLIALDSFHFDEYPEHFKRWYTPFALKRALAFCLLIAKGDFNYDDYPDMSLLDQSARAWVDKYVPEPVTGSPK